MMNISCLTKENLISILFQSMLDLYFNCPDLFTMIHNDISINNMLLSSMKPIIFVHKWLMIFLTWQLFILKDNASITNKGDRSNSGVVSRFSLEMLN